MIGPDIDALPVGVLIVDGRDRIVASNTWFRAWIGVEPVGRALDELLVVVPDFLDGTTSTLMASVADSDRVVMVVRQQSGSGAVMTTLEASDRYASGKRLRRMHSLADRTQSRLQLIMDASIAFGTANDEERLSEILAGTAARAYQAEESVVALYGDDGLLHRTAGTNPLQDAIAESVVTGGTARVASGREGQPTGGGRPALAGAERGDAGVRGLSVHRRTAAPRRP